MKQFFKQYFPYYKDYKLQFLYAFIGMVLAAAATSATAYLIKPVLDEIFINKDTSKLAYLPYLVIVAYVAKGGGAFVQSYFISYIGKDIVRRIRELILHKMLGLDLDFFHTYRSGELISRLVNDINRIQSAVSSHIAVLIREVMTALGLVGVVIYQSPKLAFYSLVVLPLAFYPLSLLAKKMKKISARSQEKNSDITASLSEIFNNVEVIKAYNSEKSEEERFAKHNLESFKIEMKGVKTSESVNPMMESLGAVAAAVVIAVGGKEVIDGHMSVGAFFSFMTALFMLYTPIRQISSIYNKFQDALAANERINHIKNLIPKIKYDGIQTLGVINELRFENVSLNYGQKRAISNVSFSVKKGESVAFVGKSGGGKSSCANLIMRFYDASEGGVLLNGENIKSYTNASLRQKIGIVTQRVYIFNDTIAKNVAYGDTVDTQKVVSALIKAHAWEFVEQLENGIETILDEFGSNLSGGQRQRIAIARALYRDPDILIFDEATSALDNKSELEVSRAIDELKGEKIVILIAHRLSTIKNADYIAVFKEGSLVCFDKKEAVESECGEYKIVANEGAL